MFEERLAKRKGSERCLRYSAEVSEEIKREREERGDAIEVGEEEVF